MKEIYTKVHKRNEYLILNQIMYILTKRKEKRENKSELWGGNHEDKKERKTSL